ncbi:MAG: adenine-specific methyltransferase EcoRI family protein [Porphyromonadaceae bacterium]|nr:adenine-specific methyltransferase EcoRI family protein [Porphyromonadaceae bacterium]
MAKNGTLNFAKVAGNDEFYTQYNDIQQEVNAYLEYDSDTFRDKTVLLPCDDPDWSKFTRFFMENFNYFGLKKLISTSYAHASKNVHFAWRPTELEINSPNFNPEKSRTHGKVFTLDRETHSRQHIDINNLEWHYLEDTGDFRSEEVVALRDEADIIVTNPPFSLFREFVSWIFEGQKKFLIIGNKNAITYKEIFTLIKANKLWVGVTSMSKDLHFFIPKYYIDSIKESNRLTAIAMEGGNILGRSPAVWFTNLEHGRRHEPLQLMTMKENIKYSRHKDIRGTDYKCYDNYNAIDIPFIDAIPSDYEKIMGVPITFLDKYCPEQFEIIGLDRYVDDNPFYGHRFTINGKESYARILIRKIN